MKPMCPYTAGCPFFVQNIPGSARAVAILRRRYCLSNHAECARKQVRDLLGPSFVPVNLYPTDSCWADSIIEAEQEKASGPAG